MKVLLLVSLLVCSSLALPSLFGTVQSAAVKGRLVCNGQPAKDVKVKLYDVDTLDPDDLMAEGVTLSNGSFQLSGSEKENTKIDPKLNIYHKCNHAGICLKKIAVVIPKDYVSEGEHPTRTFDIGELNLAGQFSGESIDCIN